MTRLLILPAIFVAATVGLWIMISSAPGWSGSVDYGAADIIDDDATINLDDDRPSLVLNVDAAGSGAGNVGFVDRALPKAQSDSLLSASADNRRPTPSRLSHRRAMAPIQLPSQFDNFTLIAEQFRAYKQEHYFYITSLFICAYLYKQTFAIPGSFLLNIIAGAVFGMWTGFFMVCVLTTCGSTLCYLFSELFSREYVLYYFGERLTYLQQKIDDNSHRLLPFLLFARMFPISPSWLLNIVAPFLNIPLPIFAFSAFIGLAPYNFICVQAGFILGDLKSWEDVFSTSTMLKLCSFALLPLAYALFVRRHQPKTLDNAAGSLGSGAVVRGWRRVVCCCCGGGRRKRRRVMTGSTVAIVASDEEADAYEDEPDGVMGFDHGAYAKAPLDVAAEKMDWKQFVV